MGNPSLQHQCNEFAGLIWSLIPSPKGPAQTAPVGGDNPWALSREGTGTEGPQAAAPPAAPAVSSLHLPFHIYNITLMPTKREQALPAAAARAVPAPRHLRPPAPRRGPFGGSCWWLHCQAHHPWGGNTPTLDQLSPPCRPQGMLEGAVLSPGHRGDRVPRAGGRGCSSPRQEGIL